MPGGSPQDTARRCAAIMRAGDAAARLIGVALDEIGPGRSVTSLTVEERHLNSGGICHGGVVFTLADMAFAYACNSYNRTAVAQHDSIQYLSPGKLGERLVAEASERVTDGRSGIYDVSVRGEGGRVVAEFRGHSRQIAGTHFDPEGDSE